MVHVTQQILSRRLSLVLEKVSLRRPRAVLLTTMAMPITLIPSLTMEEEGNTCLLVSNLHWIWADRWYSTATIDNIVLARITNDERPLKRVIKKFHNYINVSTASTKLDDTAQIRSINDTKEAFLIELASLQLLLKKSVMTCEAETRQVEEYQKERQNIGITTN